LFGSLAIWFEFFKLDHFPCIKQNLNNPRVILTP
jgi:hypothetical protein